jgi:hypothetical protein
LGFAGSRKLHTDAAMVCRREEIRMYLKPAKEADIERTIK